MVEEVSRRVTDIAQASERQRDNVKSVTEALGQVNQVTQTTAATAEESSGLSNELAHRAKEMTTLVAQFKIGEDEEPTMGLRTPRADRKSTSKRRPALELPPAGVARKDASLGSLEYF